MRAANPAFDVTPHRLISAIITERGIARADYRSTLRRLTRAQRTTRRRSISRER